MACFVFQFDFTVSQQCILQDSAPRQTKKLALVDATISLEIVILGLVTGPNALKHFAERIAGCLPCALVPAQPEAAAQRLEALRCSEVARLAPLL